VNSISPHSALLNESNWNEVISNISEYPFRISEIHSLNKEIRLSSVSFKYNIEGKERYFNGLKETCLTTGEYLIASNQTYCEVDIQDSGMLDLGLCVDINLDYLSQGLSTLLEPNQIISKANKYDYFIEDDFFMKYKTNKEFHRYITSLFLSIKHHQIEPCKELEFEFIKQFLFHQTPFLLAYSKVPAIKKSTRNELFDKMMMAKNMIQDSVYSNITIPEICKALFLSEFRFFHLFKETFQVSPHKYLLQIKLNEAISLYRTNLYNWTEIANKLQFADVQSFSKLFKRHFRMSPTAYLTYR